MGASPRRFEARESFSRFLTISVELSKKSYQVLNHSVAVMQSETDVAVGQSPVGFVDFMALPPANIERRKLLAQHFTARGNRLNRQYA